MEPRLFRSSEVNRIMRIMLGFMSPEEMATLIKDREVARTDIPKWVDLMIRKNCKLVVARLPRYEVRIRERFGVMNHIVEKLAVWHLVNDNWDGLEPCNFDRLRTLRQFYDSNIDRDLRNRIRRANDARRG